MSSTAPASARSQRLIELLGRVDYRLAETEADKEIIYKLRYRAYRRENAVAANAERRVSDRFDEAPNSWIFGVYFEGELASSLRITVSTPQHPCSPSVDVFPDILKPNIERGAV